MLGGAFCLICYCGGALLSLTLPLRAALIALPLVWLSAQI